MSDLGLGTEDPLSLLTVLSMSASPAVVSQCGAGSVAVYARLESVLE